MAVNIASYIGNLGKSITYAAVDKFKDMSPATSEFVESNSELFKEVYNNVREYRTTYARTSKAFKSSKIYEASDLFFNSLFEDLQSGKLYNREREEKINEKLAGSIGGSDLDMPDINVDMNFDDSGNDILSESDNLLADMVDKSSERNAQMISNTVARTGQYIVENQKTSTHILYTQNLQAYGMFNGNLSAINQNMSNMVRFSNDVVKTHADNSKKFFEQATKNGNEQTALLRQIVNLLSPSNAFATANTKKANNKKLTFGDIIGAEGTPDLKRYAQYVQQNLKTQWGSYLPNTDMMGDGNVLLAFAASPLSIIPKYIVEKIIPDTLETAVKKLDDSISGFFGSLVAKFNNMGDSDNPIVAAIGKLLGINPSVKSSIDTSNYEKGKVDWDGKSRKALIEVIPTYLRKILSVLSGKGEVVFDYDGGKFIEADKLKNNLDKDKESYQKSATKEMREEFSKYMKLLTFNSLQDKKDLEEDINNFFKALYDKGGFFDINSNTIEDDYSKYNVRSKNFKFIRTMFSKSGRGAQFGINRDILDQRNRQDERMRNLEMNSSLYNALFDDSKIDEFVTRNKKGNISDTTGIGSNLVKTLDNKGKNVFYYLQNIYRELNFMRQYGSGKAGDLSNVDPDIYHNGKKIEGRTNTITDIQIPDSSTNTKQAVQDRKDKENEEKRFLEQQQRMLDKHKKNKTGEMFVNASEIDEDDINRSFGGSIDNNLFTTKYEKNRKKEPTLIDKLLQSESLTDKTKVVFDKLNDITKKPLTFITNTIDKVDERLYEVIYGKNVKYKGKDIKGFLNVMIYEVKDTFGKLNNWIDEKLLKPLRDKLQVDNMKDLGKKVLNAFGIDAEQISKSIKEYFFGDNGLFKGIGDGIKRAFVGAFNTVKESTKKVFSPIVNKFNEIMPKKKKEEGQGEGDEEQSIVEQMISSSINKQKTDEEREWKNLSNKDNKEYSKLFKLPALQDMIKQYSENKDIEKERLELHSIKNELEQTLDELTDPNKNIKNVNREQRIKKYDSRKNEYDKRQKEFDDYNKNKSILDRYSRMKEKGNKRDEIRNNYSSAILNSLGIDDQDPKAKLVEELFSSMINMKTMNNNHRLSDVIRKSISMEKGNGNYKEISDSLNQYLDLFGNKNVTMDYVHQFGGTLSKRNGLTEDDVKNSAFLSDKALSQIHDAESNHDLKLKNNIFEKINQVGTETRDILKNIYDLLKNAADSAKSKVKSKFPSVFNLGKKSNYNNLNIPGMSEESQAIDDFSSGLTKMISDYFKQNIQPHAKGSEGEVDKTQVTTIQKGEIVLNKKDAKTFRNLMKYLNKSTDKGMSEEEIYNNIPEFLSKFVSNSGITSSKNVFSKYVDNLDPKILKQISSGDKIGKISKIISKISKDGKASNDKKDSESLIEQTAKEMSKAVNKTRIILFGDDKTDKKAFGDMINDLTQNVSKYAPDAIGSGLVGGGVSLLTGAIGGPLLGAAVGAGISLTKNSEKAQEWLFGKMNEDGEREGGFVGKDTIKTLKKYVPDVKNFGIAGGVAGLLPFLPFGPVGGILLGSAAGFAKNTEVVKKGLFGKEEGLFNEKRVAAIKKVVPRTMAALVPSLFMGPFGMLGNALMGTSLGLLSNTEGFNNAVFGKYNGATKQYENGILPTLRDTMVKPIQKFYNKISTRTFNWIEKKIFTPLESAVSPIAKQIEVMITSTFDGVGKFINKLFEESIGVPLNALIKDKIVKPFTKIFGGLFKAVMFPAKFIISSPFKMVAGMGNMLRKRQIRKGNAQYMTAAERNEFRRKKGTGLGRDEFSNFDHLVENIDKDTLSSIYDDLNNIANSDKVIRKKKTDLKYEIGNEVTGYLGTYNKGKKAMTAINEGDFDYARDMITSKRTDQKANDTKVLNQLNGYINGKMKNKDNINSLLNYINKHIEDPVLERKLIGLIKQNKFEEVRKLFEAKMKKDDHAEKNMMDFLNKKTLEYSVINDNKEASENIINKSYEALSKAGFDNINSDNIKKYLNMIEVEKKARDKENKGDQTDENKEFKIIEDQKAKKYYEPIVSTLHIIAEELKNISKTSNEVTKAKIDSQPDADSTVDTFRRASFRFVRVNNKEEKTKDTLDNTIKKYNESKEKKAEDKVIEKSGLNPDTTEHNFLGGIIKNTTISALSKGEAVFSKDNTDKIINAVPEILKNQVEIPEILQDSDKNEGDRHRETIGLIQSSLDNLKLIANYSKYSVNDFLVKKKQKKKETVIDSDGNPIDLITTKDGEKQIDMSDSGNREILKQKEENKNVQKGILARLSQLPSLFKSKEDPYAVQKTSSEKMLDLLKKIAVGVGGLAVSGATGKYVQEHVMPKVEEEWDTNVKPWLNNKVLPWIKEKGFPSLIEGLKNTLMEAITKGVPMLADGLKWALTDGMPQIVHGVAKSVKFAVTEMYPALLKSILNEMGLSGEHGESSLPGEIAYVAGRDALTGGGNISKAVTKYTTTNKFKSPKVGEILTSPLKSTAKGLGNVTAWSAKFGFKGLGKIVDKVAVPINKLYGKLDNTKLFNKLPSLNNIKEGIQKKGNTLAETMKQSFESKAKKSALKSMAIDEAKGLVDANQGLVKTILESMKEGLLKIFRASPVIKLVGEDGSEALCTKFMPRFLEAIGKNLAKSTAVVTAKLAASISTGGLINIGFAIEGFISGYRDCRSILGITDVPTTNMRIATGTIRAISSAYIITSIIPEKLYVDLVLDIILPIFGVKNTDIQNDRKKADKEVEKYNKEHGTKYSVEQYNKEVLGDKSIWQTVKDKFKKSVDKVKKTVVDTWNKTKKAVSDAYEGSKLQGFIKSLMSISQYTRDVVTSSIKTALDMETKKDINSVKLDKNDPLYSIKKIIFYGAKTLMMPSYLMLKTGKLLYDNAGKIWDGFIDLGKYQEKLLETGVKSAWDLSYTEYWTLPATDDNSPVSPFKKIMFYTNRILGAPIYGTISLGKLAFNGIKTIWDGFVEFGNYNASIFSSGFNSMYVLDFNSYFSMPTTDDNSPVSPFKKIMFYTNRILGAPIYSILALGKGAINGIKTIWDGFVEFGNYNASIFSSGLDAMYSLDFSTYFSMPITDEGPVSPFKKIMFYTNRILGAPIYGTLALGKGVINGVESIWRGFTEFGNYNASLFSSGLDSMYSLDFGSYFSMADDDGTPLSPFKKIMFYTNRILGAPIYGTLALGKGVINGVESIWNSFQGLGSFIDSDSKNIETLLDSDSEKSYWETLQDEGTAASPLKKFLFYMNRIMNAPMFYVRKFIKGLSASKGITWFKENIAKLFDLDTYLNSDGQGGVDTPVSKTSYNKLLQTDSKNIIINNNSKGAIPVFDTKKSKISIGGGSSDIQNQLLTKFSMPTAEQLNAWIGSKNSKSPFVGHGDIFIKAGQKTGLDPRYLVAHAALESGWGTATLGKNNYYGIGAFNSSPQASALKFSGGMEQGIVGGAQWIYDNFTKGGQDTLYKMLYGKPGHSYATYNDEKTPNKEWMTQIASIMSSAPQNDGTLFSSGNPDSTSSEKKDNNLSGMFSALDTLMNNTFNKLYGFDITGSSSSGNNSSTSLSNTESSNVATDWFTQSMPGSSLSSKYGPRVVNGVSGVHKGIDIAASARTPIKSPIQGKVVQNTYEAGGFGNYLVIEDSNGAQHYFGHMVERSPLTVGASVRVGDTLGYVGSTGRSTGPHLHYEVRENGQSEDPNGYLDKIYQNKLPNIGGGKLRNKLKLPEVKYNVGGNVTDTSTANINLQPSTSISTTDKLINTIISILVKISDNTGCLTEIVKLLSEALNVNIPKEKLQNMTASNNKANVINLLKTSLQSSNNDVSTNEYLLRTLSSLASE